MEQFAYSFAITMMHSVWQMALLLLFYYMIVSAFRQWPPIAKRNLLLFLVAAQVLSSLVSFYFIYSKPFLDYREDIQAFLQSFSSTQNWLQQYAPVIVGLYAFGLLYKLSHAWFNWKSFNRFYKSSLIKPSVETRLFTNTKAFHFGIKRKVTIWFSNHIQSPVTFGFFKPVILLPVALVNQLNIQQTESLIVHELTHIKNNDYLLNWLLLVADALFFFNPFVKITIQKIKREREKSCDVQVLQFNYPAISYAEALLHIAQQQQIKASVAVAAVSKKTELLDRIRYFSDEKNINDHQSRYFSFAALLTWSFIALNIFFAGVFVTTSKPVHTNQLNTLFAALPVNEWNKSFATENIERPATPLNTAVTEPSTFPVTTEDQDRPLAAVAIERKKPAEKISLSLSEPAYTNEPLILTPVSFTETKPAPAVTVKDVIIDEEVSGIKITQAYRVTTTVSGEVKMEPLWMISEMNPSDSLKIAIKQDSSIIRVVPVVQ